MHRDKLTFEELSDEMSVHRPNAKDVDGQRTRRPSTTVLNAAQETIELVVKSHFHLLRQDSLTAVDPSSIDERKPPLPVSLAQRTPRFGD